MLTHWLESHVDSMVPESSQSSKVNSEPVQSLFKNTKYFLSIITLLTTLVPLHELSAE